MTISTVLKNKTKIFMKAGDLTISDIKASMKNSYDFSGISDEGAEFTYRVLYPERNWSNSVTNINQVFSNHIIDFNLIKDANLQILNSPNSDIHLLKFVCLFVDGYVGRNELFNISIDELDFLFETNFKKCNAQPKSVVAAYVSKHKDILSTYLAKSSNRTKAADYIRARYLEKLN